MSCNSWNHPPDCNCGWGGDTRTGTGGTFINLPSSSHNFSGGRNMAEFKITKGVRNAAFNECCDTLLNMSFEILNTEASIGSSNSFKIEAHSRNGYSSVYVTVELYCSNLIVAGKREKWLNAKKTVEQFLEKVK